jgi:hypothetical protein
MKASRICNTDRVVSCSRIWKTEEHLLQNSLHQTVDSQQLLQLWRLKSYKHESLTVIFAVQLRKKQRLLICFTDAALSEELWIRSGVLTRGIGSGNIGFYLNDSATSILYKYRYEKAYWFATPLITCIPSQVELSLIRTRSLLTPASSYRAISRRAFSIYKAEK